MLFAKGEIYMKKTFKTLLAICCLALCLVFCLTACGDKNDDDTVPGHDDAVPGHDGTVPGHDDTVPEYADIILEYGSVLFDWADFRYDGNIEDLDITSSDENVFQVLSAEPGENGHVYIRLRAFGVGTATLTAKTSDGSFLEERTVEVQKEKPVYIGQGELCESITLDKTEAEVYKDDTTVTYTVTTSNDVDKIELIQLELIFGQRYFKDFIENRYDENYATEIYKLEIDDRKLVDSLTLDESNGRYYAASKSTEGGKTVWTIKWNLGDTAVRFVQVNTIDSDTNTRQENYVRLNIEYPLIDASLGLEGVIKRWVELNLDKPFLYEIDTRTLTDEQLKIYLSRTGENIYLDEEFVLLGMLQKRSEMLRDDYKIDKVDNQTLYDKLFDAPAIYRDNFVSGLQQYAMVTGLNFTEEAENDFQNMDLAHVDRVLVNSNYEARTHRYYYTISDEIRAVIAYENGYEIDAEKFPYAHSILERASAVLDEIITDGMTDFEKEKAIYTWMYEQGLKELTPPPEDVDEYNLFKTAYGFLNNYGGDCMGWSGTFFTLCNMAGVECSTVDVRAIEPGETGGAASDFEANHRINHVRLDGEYYFVDSHWSYQQGEKGEYKTLNMTSDVASESYIWMDEEGFGPIPCNYETYLVDAHTGELLNK